MLKLYNQLIDTILYDIIPKTNISIKKGNKIFGAAILNKKDLSIICIGTNNEIINPLYHGEISTLNNFYKLSNIKSINISNCIFLSTHEPCSLCLSAITWAGFDNFYFFFPYAKTKDDFNIPHDLNILKEVFNIPNGNYLKKNKYWKSFSIIKEINKIKTEDTKILITKIQKINNEYSLLSKLYQKNKNINKIPLN